MAGRLKRSSLYSLLPDSMASKRSSIGVHLMSTRHRLELQELFEAVDKDKDGKISPTDLEAMLNTAGVAAGTTTVPSMVTVYTYNLLV